MPPGIRPQARSLTAYQRAAASYTPRRGMFGDLTGAATDYVNMYDCLASGGTWDGATCYAELGGGGEGGGTDLNTTTPTTPGAVPVREANWDLEGQPYATYKIASGDTFVGLAATYLGDGGRWKEIWTTGGNAQKFPNPNVIQSIGPLDMPEEARDRMKAWINLGKQGKPGDIPPSKVAQAKSKTKYIVAAGVAAVAAVGLGVGIYHYAKS